MKKRIEILKSICIFTIDELMTKIKKRDVRNGRYYIKNCEIEVDSVRYRVSDVDIDVFVSKTGELRIEIPNVECETFQVRNMEIFVEEGNIRIRVDTLTGTFPLSSLSSVRVEIAKFENELYTVESLHADLSSKSNNIKAKRVETSLSFDRFSSSFWQPNLTTMCSTRIRIERFSSRITVSSQIKYLLLTCQDLNFHYDKEDAKSLRLRMSKIRCESIRLFAITNTHQKIQISKIRVLEFDGGLHESVPSSSSVSPTSITTATSKTSLIVTRTRSNFSMLTASFYKRPRRNSVLNTLNIAFGDAWKKRFFTLSRFALSYYDTSDSPYPLGRIDMKENILARFIKDSLLEFEIVSKESSGRLLHVRAQSTVEAKRWIHEINCRSQEMRETVRRVNRNVSDDEDTMGTPENGVTLRHISLKCQDVELYVSVKELYVEVRLFSPRYHNYTPRTDTSSYSPLQIKVSV